MKKKLKIAELKVSSFVTKDEVKATAGGYDSFPQCTGQATCALYCSDTNGRGPCKDTTNLTAYFC